MTTRTTTEWLQSYATSRHDWHHRSKNGHSVYYRRGGIVEGLFNVDGTDFEGRADVATEFFVELRTTLNLDDLKNRILLVWSIFRQKHVLLASKAVKAIDLEPDDSEQDLEDYFFLFEPSPHPERMVKEAKEHLDFVQDHYPDVDEDEFFKHALNTGRCIDASKALSRLYVMPIKPSIQGVQNLHFICIAAHEITDGLTVMRWLSSFIDLFNMSAQELAREAESLCSQSPVPRLPPAQETLYPPIKGSAARQRWFWLLTRILRHTRKPPPASFQNPLRRRVALGSRIAMEPKYPEFLNYSRVPPLNTFAVRAVLGPAPTRRLFKICREAGISIGSGCFALVAVVMMLMEELRDPHVAHHNRLPFVGSFPVNPRPFLTGKSLVGKEDSLMLAFSDGVTLPFLSSDLDLEGRLRLLGKQADRQLRRYQKRPRSLTEEVNLGSRSPTQLLPMLYLDTMERLQGKTRASRKRQWDIQGAYPAKSSGSMATCGISSIGARHTIIPVGKYDTRRIPENKDMVADFRDSESNVRARDGEFLVGVVGDNGQLRFNVSYDACAIDPLLADEWKRILETLLEPGRPLKL
ncbi:hypothetical protein ABEF95_011067 [Exophiala dermatitidis]